MLFKKHVQIKAKYNAFGKAILATVLLAGIGFATTQTNAEELADYCNLVLCSSSDTSSDIKQALGLGDSTLGWWDCRIQNKCQDLSDEIHKLKMNEEQCSMDMLVSYRQRIHDIGLRVREILSKFDPQIQEQLAVTMTHGLTGELRIHYKRCYDSGLFFAPNPLQCVSDNCTKALAAVEKLQVNHEDCTKPLHEICPDKCQNWDFGYEEGLVLGKVDEFRQKCIDANFLPAVTIFNLPILKKDVPFARMCLDKGGQLDYTIGSLKIIPDQCTSALYTDLNKQVAEYGDALAKLGDESTAHISNSQWHEKITNGLTNKIDTHFIKCEQENFFPTNKTECLSQQCKDLQNEIKSFKIDKEDCVVKQNNVVIHTLFNFENQVIKDELDAFRQRCVDSDFLPYKTIAAKWVTKSEYETQYQAVENQISSMGVEGDQTWPDTETKIIPYPQLVSMVKALTFTKQMCNVQKHITPLKTNVANYILIWRNAGFPSPAELDTMESALNLFTEQCKEKHLS